ncbi:MAG: hypothetical protein JNM56_36815, partial [Planctomycetia bacterium]|nr:hypothetical protein [Planctomycetia bacterium]
MHRIRRLFLVVLLACVGPLLAQTAAPPDPLAEARQRVEKLKATDPQRYAVLQQNYAYWSQLSPERQAALRKLDQDLQDETAYQRGRYERVLERYTDWLERLPEADRQSIASAPNRAARVQRIQEIRDREWLARLPKGQLDRIAKAPEAERAALTRQAIRDHLEDRLDWLVVGRNPAPAPARRDHLPKETQDYLEKNLMPLLSTEEEQRLRNAEGKWPRYPRTLIELLDQHPLTVEGPIGPVFIRDTPMNPLTMVYLEKDKNLRPLYNRLKDSEGKWPEYGQAVREATRSGFVKKFIVPLHPKFMPGNAADFPPPVQEFVNRKLKPALDDAELVQLRAAEGQWPNYPQLLLELAAKHNLTIPSGTNRWDFLDRYRYRPQTA